jgi:hypothetical protein
MFYRHDGWVDGTARFSHEAVRIGRGGWADFRKIFSGGNGTIYGVSPAGDLMFYRHDGWVDGTARFSQEAVRVGRGGWTHFKFISAAGEGVIYAVPPELGLRYYKHDGWVDGSDRFSQAGVALSPAVPWSDFLDFFVATNGVIYAVAPAVFCVTIHADFGRGVVSTNHTIIARDEADAERKVQELIAQAGMFYTGRSNLRDGPCF